MTAEYFIRPAVTGDAEQILEIYRPFVEKTVVTFEYETPSVQAFQERMLGILSFYPYLVCEHDGKIVGYAYASRHRERAAYQWNAELSIYVCPEEQHSGIGIALYGALIELLRMQGIVNVYGVITHPNEKSERFHQKLGFEVCGISHRTGWKLDRWIDVCEMELRIAPQQEKPQPVKALNQLDSQQVAAVLSRINQKIKN